MKILNVFELMQYLIILLSLIVSGLVQAKVTETMLDNGMKIIVKEDHRSPVMVSQVWYKVGSSYEYGGITGVSHILEHMMFKGTKNLKPNEFSEIISYNGGRENAFTGRDYTAYFQRMEKSLYPLSFELEAERMRNLKLDAAEFAKEREVVAEERRLRTDNDPESLAFEQFVATAYVNSPYHHPIIGWMTDIKNMQLDDLQTWYQKWYAPNNAVLVVAGDVEPEKVIAEARKHFGPLKPSEVKPPKPQQEIPSLGPKEIKIKLPAKVPYLLMGYPVPSISSARQVWEPYALEILAYVLDGGRSSRIAKNVIRGSKVGSYAGVGYDATNRLQTLFMLSGSPSGTKTLEDLRRSLLQEIEKLKTELVDPVELDRIKTQLLASKVYQRDSVFYQAMQIGKMEAIGLSWKVAEEFVDKLSKVTAAQLQQVAQKYLVADKLIVASLIVQESTPEQAVKPSEGLHE